MQIVFNPEELKATRKGLVKNKMVDVETTKKIVVEITNNDPYYTHSFHIIVFPADLKAVTDAEIQIKEKK